MWKQLKNTESWKGFKHKFPRFGVFSDFRKISQQLDRAPRKRQGEIKISAKKINLREQHKENFKEKHREERTELCLSTSMEAKMKQNEREREREFERQERVQGYKSAGLGQN